MGRGRGRHAPPTPLTAAGEDWSGPAERQADCQVCPPDPGLLTPGSVCSPLCTRVKGRSCERRPWLTNNIPVPSDCQIVIITFLICTFRRDTWGVSSPGIFPRSLPRLEGSRCHSPFSSSFPAFVLVFGSWFLIRLTLGYLSTFRPEDSDLLPRHDLFFLSPFLSHRDQLAASLGSLCFWGRGGGSSAPAPPGAPGEQRGRTCSVATRHRMGRPRCTSPWPRHGAGGETRPWLCPDLFRKRGSGASCQHLGESHSQGQPRSVGRDREAGVQGLPLPLHAGQALSPPHPPRAGVSMYVNPCAGLHAK